MGEDRGTIQVRRAVPDDASAIASVLYRAFVEFEAAYSPDAFAATTPTLHQILARFNEGPLWVAIRDAVIVGTVSVMPQGESLYLRSMGVLPESRGHGVGWQLLEHAEHFARQERYQRLLLSTTPFLAGAIALYERAGFSRSPEGLSDLFGTPLVAMVKPTGVEARNDEHRRSVPVPDVILRPTTTADLDFVLAAEADSENRPFVLLWTREQHATAIGSPGFAHRIVEDTSSGQSVGYVILLGLDGAHRAIEFRRLVVTAKGCGYGRAAVRAIKRLAFEELGAHRLWLDVKEFNQRARRLYESQGFVVEGLLRECYLGAGGFESVYVMSVLESEYRRS